MYKSTNLTKLISMLYLHVTIIFMKTMKKFIKFHEKMLWQNAEGVWEAVGTGTSSFLHTAAFRFGQHAMILLLIFSMAFSIFPGALEVAAGEDTQLNLSHISCADD